MIAAKPPQVVAPKQDWQDWKAQWRNSFTDTKALLAFLGLQDTAAAKHIDANARFALRVPHSFARRMRFADPLDPLLAQVLPLQLENAAVPGFVSDPVADLAHSPVPGVVHKYASRALLIAAGTCAINCRYCFRREFPYSDASLSNRAMHQAMDYLRQQPLVSEVILSGGDPLALDNTKLAALLAQLRALPQLRRLRIHARTPIVLPARVDAGLVALLADFGLPVVMVLHSNHANEWNDPELQSACQQLRAAGVHLLNQAVLLAGVNADVQAQVALSEALFSAGVLPYYLNQLDQVTGSAHFAVSDADARQLHQQMAARLPGYLLPRLVRDVPGQASKTPL
jgi:L-lysine 2,3-aminomutase